MCVRRPEQDSKRDSCPLKGVSTDYLNTLQNEAKTTPKSGRVFGLFWRIALCRTDGRAVPLPDLLPFPPEMRRRIVVGQRERPFYGDKARTDGWEGREQREGDTAAISGELDRVKKREGGRKGKERESGYLTRKTNCASSTSLSPSVGRKDETLAITVPTRMSRPCIHLN